MTRLAHGLRLPALEGEAPCRCPRCGRRLLVSTTVVISTPVALYRSIAGPTTAVHTLRATEPIGSILRDQLADDYGRGLEVDERQDIFCERCDYVTHAAELEGRA